MQLAISRLNKVIELGKTKTIPTRTIQGSKAEFVPSRTLHCAIYQRTQAQQYQIFGTDLQDTIVIVVRSQAKVDDVMRVRFKGDTTVYRIINISRDASHNFPRYDLLTLRDIKKGGADNAQ